MSFKNISDIWEGDAIVDLSYLASVLESGNMGVATTVCTDMKNKYTLSNILREVKPDCASLRKDQIAESLLPDDVPCALTAKQSTANGSCFYNSISLSLVGSEHLSSVLRILVAIELFENAEWYSDEKRIDDIIGETSISMSKTSLFVMITSCENIKPGTNRKNIVKNVAVLTCNTHEWASLIHYMAAASVLQRPIFSVYPKCGTAAGIRPLYHTEFRPRMDHGVIFKDQDPIFVMWTRLSSSTLSKWFQPNHFVPLFPQAVFKNDHYDAEFPPLSRTVENQPKSYSARDQRNHFVPLFPQAEFQNDRFDAEFPPLLQTGGKNRRKRTKINKSPKKKLKPFIQEGLDAPRNTISTSSPKHEPFQPNVQFPTLSRNWYKRQARNADDDNSKKADPEGKKKPIPGGEKVNSSALPFPRASEKWHEKQPNQEKNDIEDNKKSSNLPFYEISRNWYKKRGKLFGKNQSRKHEKKLKEEEKSLDESVLNLETKLKDEKISEKSRTEFKGILETGKYLINNGPLVAAQEISKVYRESMKSSAKRKLRSSELLQKLEKYFNIIKIHICGTAYILENKYPNIDVVVRELESNFKSTVRKNMNDHIKDNIGTHFNSALAFSDTKKDRDIIKALFAKATSVRFVTNLMGVKSKSAVMSCRDEFEEKLSLFGELSETSQVVRNDMTCEQQRRLTKRIIEKRKQNLTKLCYENRGRILKAELFPQLGVVLENIFQEGGTEEIGGLECHPRLTTDIRYRSKDNNFFMREARKILLSVAPPDFSIELSTCYNYTESYKDGTYAAKRHHSGSNINARISLKQPPRIGAQKYVINLHWSTKNVNLLLEEAEGGSSDQVIDSRDAKSMICGDIPPVQLPGKSWKPIIYPDHTFDQGRNNAVYPKTHLFMDATKFQSSSGQRDATSTNNVEDRVVTRTGKTVMLVNTGFFEPETTFRGMNEILHMLTLPELDEIFRNPTNGKLKSILNFIVDNGPSEDPDSPLTQMCMVRILRMLSLSKISQRSFAEYHSKRNFAERPHAAANEVLSRHGSFDSSPIHKNASVGSNEHRENMEAMADNVKQCLSQAKFGGHFITALRGVTEKEKNFNDEDKLKQFLALSEERKNECTWTYKPVPNPCLETLTCSWGILNNFEGSYAEDYKIISNATDPRSWKDKYSTTIFSKEEAAKDGVLNVEQPVPDYVRWFQSNGELHYLSFEKTVAIVSQSKEIVLHPGEFLPTRLLNLFFQISSEPPETVLADLAFLCWVPFGKVQMHFKEQREKMEKEYENDLERQRWKQHHLYGKRMEDLQDMCIKKDIHHRGLQKHELISLLSAKTDKDPPPNYKPIYNGNVLSLPEDITAIKKLPVTLLKFILKCHGITFKGSKDQLVLRVFLLRHRRHRFAFKSQVDEVKFTIELAKKIMYAEIEHSIVNTEIVDIRRKRKYSTAEIVKDKSELSIPNEIDDLPRIPTTTFCDLMDYMETLSQIDRTDVPHPRIDKNLQPATHTDLISSFFEIGQRIKVRWTADEIGDTGWRAGWYIAEVQRSDIESDKINIVYSSEPNSVYEVEVTPSFIEGKLRLWKKNGGKQDKQ